MCIQIDAGIVEGCRFVFFFDLAFATDRFWPFTPSVGPRSSSWSMTLGRRTWQTKARKLNTAELADIL